MRYQPSIHADHETVQFLRDRLGVDLSAQQLGSSRWFSVTVRDSERDQFMGQVVAALACEFVQPWEATFTAAIDDPGSMSRGLLKAIFGALFSRARRLTAHVEPGNTHAEEIVQRLGFVYEGFSRRGYDGDRDALVYGMLREDCRYLPGVRATRPNGGPDAPTVTAEPLRYGVGAAVGQRRRGVGQRYH